MPASLRVMPLAVVAFAASHLLHQQVYLIFPYQAQTADQGVSAEVLGKVLDSSNPTSTGRVQFAFRVQEVTIAERTYHCAHLITVQLKGVAPQYGDVMRLSGKLSLPELPRNPGQFNYLDYLKRQDMVGLLAVAEGDVLEVIDRKLLAWKSRALAARAWMAHAITRDLDNAPEITGILTAMALGMRKNTTEAIE